MASKKVKNEPPDQAPELFQPIANIFQDLGQNWSIGDLVRQAYEAIHSEDSIEPVMLVLGDTKIHAWYDDETEVTHIQVGGEIE